jgi:hypothetical protein
LLGGGPVAISAQGLLIRHLPFATVWLSLPLDTGRHDQPGDE